MSDERKENSTPYGSTSDDDQISLLEAFDRAVASLPLDIVARERLLALRAEIAAQEEMVGDAREMIEKLEQVIKKVTSPANRIGTFLGSPARDTAQIVVGGADYYCNVDPRISLGKLQQGTRVLVNEAYVIVGDLGFETAGPVTKVAEVLGPDRLRVGAEHGTQSLVLQRSAQLAKAKLKAGDEVRVDANYRVALEVLASPQSHESLPRRQCPSCRGKKSAARRKRCRRSATRSSCRCLHADLFQRFQHATPKGFLLYGPPGCGKTLIGKATAYNLTQQLRNKSGEEMREYFMHIKGPEILNMWVGESERMVREIFATAREKRREGYMPFLFIDEAESILGTRRASRYSSILSTLVPMFCTEMDGIDSLNEVVIILASNRADLIDPAILRPGRIDRKIKVKRPNKEGAREIYRIYLTDDLPYDAALLAGTESKAAAIDHSSTGCSRSNFRKRDENQFLEVTLRSGRKETLYRSDLISGAIIASVVERAKGMAIKRAIANGKDEGISEVDLQVAYNAEYLENEILPATDITEDWLKLIDYDPDNVVKISPVRLIDRAKAKPSSGII